MRITPFDEGAEDLGALEAERPPVVGRACGDGARDQRDHQGCGIREHVSRISKQRQRSGQRRADDLHDHDDRGDRE